MGEEIMGTHVPLANKATAVAGLLLLATSAPSKAAELKQETLQAWQDYIRTADSRMQERLDGSVPFLWIDESAERSRRVRAGEIVVTPVGQHSPIKVSK